jgi:hypothetical protein
LEWPKGGKMKRLKGAMGPTVVIFVAAALVLALTQSNAGAQAITVPPASATAGTLSPPEIVAQVRRAGFDPVSRPVQRGNVYVLFALDPDYLDVRLTVDARSGRVLWVTDVGGRRYGDSAYYGYRVFSREERPPIPPGDIPNIGPARSNLGPVRSNASVRRSPPLPRLRPTDLTGAAPKESAQPVQGDPKATVPLRSDIPPGATARPAPPTMVPIAPLE